MRAVLNPVRPKLALKLVLNLALRQPEEIKRVLKNGEDAISSVRRVRSGLEAKKPVILNVRPRREILRAKLGGHDSRLGKRERIVDSKDEVAYSSM
jgi:hypothetical protein